MTASLRWMALGCCLLWTVAMGASGCATGSRERAEAYTPDGWPIDPRFPVTSRFGAPRGGRGHSGIDIGAPKGTPVVATAPGRVIYGGRDDGGYGKLVRIDHGNGVETWYAHLNRCSVDAGDRVRRGEVVGKVGSTGRATGPHLHYEVRLSGRAVDPGPYLTPRLAVAQGD